MCTQMARKMYEYIISGELSESRRDVILRALIGADYGMQKNLSKKGECFPTFFAELFRSGIECRQNTYSTKG